MANELGTEMQNLFTAIKNFFDRDVMRRLGAILVHRNSFNDWPYNLLTMVHGNSEQECLEIMKGISNANGINNYEPLFNDRELKKISIRYFNE